MYQTILVPLDGSKLAEIALPHAESLASRYNAKLILLSVIDPPIITNQEVNAMDVYQQQTDTLRQDSELYLKGLQGQFNQKKIKTQFIVRNGPVVEGIISTAEKFSADLVIIASHGRTGLMRVFFGSVAAGVLNRIEQPLMIIRSSQ